MDVSIMAYMYAQRRLRLRTAYTLKGIAIFAALLLDWCLLCCQYMSLHGRKVNSEEFNQVNIVVSLTVETNGVLQSPRDINPHKSSYLIEPKDVCDTHKVFLLIYVHSAPNHFIRRKVIRETWGNPAHYDDDPFYADHPFRLIFVLGKARTSHIQELILTESQRYNDIVQKDFVDVYRNLTFKAIAGLKWIATFCRQATFVLKTDDDVLVNMFLLFRHLRGDLYDISIGTEGLLECKVYVETVVARSGTKWKTEFSEFNETYYPPYCAGMAFLMTMDVAMALHNISFSVPFFWVDDVYLTGLLVRELGIEHEDADPMYIADEFIPDKFQARDYFYAHVPLNALGIIQRAWMSLVKSNLLERRGTTEAYNNTRRPN